MWTESGKQFSIFSMRVEIVKGNKNDNKNDIQYKGCMITIPVQLYIATSYVALFFVHSLPGQLILLYTLFMWDDSTKWPAIGHSSFYYRASVGDLKIERQLSENFLAGGVLIHTVSHIVISYNYYCYHFADSANERKVYVSFTWPSEAGMLYYSLFTFCIFSGHIVASTMDIILDDTCHSHAKCSGL